MIYKVRAKFKNEKAAEFLRKLTDGTIGKQKPDGYEIVASMGRATIDGDGWVNWTELCYCPSPLYHERATIYDDVFTELETEEVDDYSVFEGKSFMEFISEKSK